MKRYLAEFFGTFGLVFAGTGAIMIDDMSHGMVSHVGIGLTFGLIVLAMIYTVGDVSGAHLNPAVSFGFWIARRFPTSDLCPYIFSQCVGALSASMILRFLFPHQSNLGATVPTVPILHAFVLEVILTFFLMFVIVNVSIGAKEKGLMAGIAVGSVVALEALFAGPVTGASMNPARSLGPAVVSGQLNGLWIYLVAPILGAALAILGCRCIQADSCCAPREQSS